MRKTGSMVALLVATLLLLPGATHAQVVLYSTFGPGNSVGFGGEGFGFYSGVSPSGPGSELITVANAFTLPGGPLTGRYEFTQLDLSVFFILGCSGPCLFQVQLTADASGMPGTVLETWTISSPGPVLPPQIFTVFDALHLQLVGGSQYWVTVGAAGGPYASGAWTFGPEETPSFVTALNANGAGWQVIPNTFPNAFDIWGKPISFVPSPVGLGLNQILRIIAGPVTPPAGGPVEANLGFVDVNGNAIGPAPTPVTINPGQIVSLDFPANEYVTQLGQRVEVVPVITPLPNPNGAPGGAIQASVEVLDALLGFGTVLTSVPMWPPDPSASTLLPQGLAGGQTMQLNVQANAPNPCVATLSFADKNGSPLGSSEAVNVPPGTVMSLALNANTLGLQLGQRINVQPIVTVTSPTTSGPPINSVCQASVEVFDHVTGRTETYQTAPAQLTAVQ